ncbi:unnamed protein product, partial [Closterium sp. Naga37s-1]
MTVHPGSRHGLVALLAALACCRLPCMSLAVPIADSQGALVARCAGRKVRWSQGALVARCVCRKVRWSQGALVA